MTSRIAYLAIVACGFAYAGCAGPAAEAPAATTLAFIGQLPPSTELDMTGTFTLTAWGDLRLVLDHPCTVGKSQLGSTPSFDLPEQLPCPQSRLNLIHATAHAPWGQTVNGTWTSPSLIVFHIDWKTAGLDPLADDAADRVLGAWSVSGATWSPSEAEAALILKQIGVATDTQPDLVAGGEPPKLDVVAFGVDGDTLHTDHPNALTVRIANHGTGAAYRVVATVHAGIPALNGQRLSFGMIKPGAEKRRSVMLSVPASEAATNTMLVLSITEGNGGAPANLNKRVAITRPVTEPIFAMECQVGDHVKSRLQLDAGQYVEVRCQLHNTGNADAKEVDVEASFPGGQPVKLPPQAVAMAKQVEFSVPVVVPRDLPVDSSFEIAVTARDRASTKLASAKLAGTVRKPRLCEPGKLSQEQYQAKLAELRNSTFLSPEEFDRYDAELVSCLR